MSDTSTVALADTPKPALRTIVGVEICEAGIDWPTSTGRVTFTAEDIASAVAAQDDPALRTPIIRLGHSDPRFDGEPALGRLVNLRAVNDGLTLVGDYAGVPAWLADILGSAYPNRSLEGAFDVVTMTGSKHRFVIDAVALLGAAAPAISTLEDVARLYLEPPATVAATAMKEGRMAGSVAASVPMETVRRAYYDTVRNAWSWCREIWSDALIIDDDEGGLWRVPWSVDGEDVTFGDAEKVKVAYVPDASGETDPAEVGLVAASAGSPLARYAPNTRAALRVLAAGSTDVVPGVPDSEAHLSPDSDGVPPVDPDAPTGPTPFDPTEPTVVVPPVVVPPVIVPPPSNPVPVPTPPPGTPPPDTPVTPPHRPVPDSPAGQETAAMSAEQLAALGLDEDATPEQIADRLLVLAAAETRAQELEAAAEAAKTTPVELPEGVVAIDANRLADLEALVPTVAEYREDKRVAARAALIDGAVRAGKFTPHERPAYEALYDAAPEPTRALIDKLAASKAVPVSEVGHADTGEADADALLYAELFGTNDTAKIGA